MSDEKISAMTPLSFVVGNMSIPIADPANPTLNQASTILLLKTWMEQAFRNSTSTVAIGAGAGAHVSISSSNTVLVGTNAGAAYINGSNTVIIGGGAAPVTTGPTATVVVGAAAAPLMESAGSNVVVGAGAAGNLTTGNNNVIIGKGAGDIVTTGNLNIAIGESVNLPNATANGQINIGNEYKATVGVSATIVDPLTVNGNVTLLASSATLANGAGSGAGTLTNAPSAGNPTKWIAINDNGTTRHIPAW